MKKYIIPIVAIIILAIGGVAAANVLNPLIQSNISDNNSISSNNSNINQNDTLNTTENNNSSSDHSKSSDSDQNMKEIVKDPQKVQNYLDSEGKTHDTVVVDGQPVVLTSPTKPPKSPSNERKSPYLRESG